MTAESADTEDAGFLIAPADWPGDEASIRAIRTAVFVHEQGIDASLEWDGKDSDCAQLLAYDMDGKDSDCAQLLAYDMDGNTIATARMQADGHIGRMAVLPAWRGRGVGSALLMMLIDRAAAHALDEVYLSAQTSAASFYHQHGFIATSEEFTSAGIPHIYMKRFTSDP